MKQWMHRIGIISIVFLFICITVLSAKKESLTFDEIFNIQEGTTNLTTRTFPIEPYNPPLIRELAVLPSVLGLNPDQDTPNVKYFLNRVVVILFASILLWNVMTLTNEYFGFWPSLLSGVILTLEPTFLANSHYITPDIGLTLFIFLAYKAFLNLLISPTMTRFFFFGIFVGLSAAAKISALPFLVLTFIIVFIIKRKTFPLEWHMDHIGSTVFAIAVASFVVWGTFFFRFTPILIKHDNPERLSNKIVAFANEKQISIITQGIQLLQGTPVPLGDYLGLLKNNVIRAKDTQHPFFWGDFKKNISWYMMPYVMLIKLPIPFLLLFFIGMFLLLAPENILKLLINTEDKIKNNDIERQQRQKQEQQVMDEYRKVPRYKIRVKYDERMDKEWNYLFIVPILTIVGASAFLGMQPMIRYVLPAFPFMAIVAGSSIQSLYSNWKRVLVLFLLLWMGYETYTNFPHYISYANESIPHAQRYKYMIDSNIDWGQGLISLQEYLKQNQPQLLYFSYFGRDDAAWYEFFSDLPWGSYKNDEICQFHIIKNPLYSGRNITAISITNWYNCGYYKQAQYREQNIQDIVGDSILIFPYE